MRHVSATERRRSGGKRRRKVIAPMRRRMPNKMQFSFVEMKKIVRRRRSTFASLKFAWGTANCFNESANRKSSMGFADCESSLFAQSLGFVNQMLLSGTKLCVWLFDLNSAASVWLLEQLNDDICIERRSSASLGAENVSNTYLCIFFQLVSSSERRLLWPQPITISSLHRIKVSPSPSISLSPELDGLASWARVFVYLFPVDDLLS